MDNYRIIDMSNDKFDAAGIRLSSGKNCIYFKNKDKDYNKVIIGRDYNVDINDGEVALVFKNTDTKEDIVELTTVFINALAIDLNEISFGCNVSNENEEEEMLEIADMLNIKFFINRSEKYKNFLFQKEEAKKREEEKRKLDEEKRKKELEEINSVDKTEEQENVVKPQFVEKQADEFFKVEEDVPIKVNNSESLSDVFLQDWEQTKEERLISQKEIEPVIYEKPFVKKKKSKLVIILFIISGLLLIGAIILFIFNKQIYYNLTYSLESDKIIVSSSFYFGIDKQLILF